MTNLAKSPTVMRQVERKGLTAQSRLTVASKRHRGKVALIEVDRLNNDYEDVQLNAIADERADGPFVQVTLDDLKA